MPDLKIKHVFKAEYDLARKSMNIILDEVKKGSEIEKLKEMSDIKILKHHVANPPFSILNNSQIGDRPYKTNIDLKNSFKK